MAYLYNSNTFKASKVITDQEDNQDEGSQLETTP